MREAAEYLRFLNKDGQIDAENARRFLVRKKVQLKKRGHHVLVHVDDLNATLTDSEARA